MDSIGLSLQKFRIETGLSQKDFAASVGMKPTTYNGYEKGRHLPSFDVLMMFADKWGVSVVHLLGEDEPKKAALEKESGSNGPAKRALIEAIADLNEKDADIVLDIIRSVKRLKGE